MPRVRAARKPFSHAAPTTCDAASTGPPTLPPTPPRTTHKRKRRSRSRVTDSSSEDEDDHDVPKPESDNEDDRISERNSRKADAVFIGHKKRRTLALDAIAEELTEDHAEEAFWIGDYKTAGSSEAGTSERRPTYKVVHNRAPTRKRPRSRTRSPSSSPPPVPHLLRRGHSGLISPPPSRRAPKIARLATPPPPTRTTETKGKAVALPALDSPNNPFLASDSPGSIPSEDLSSPEPLTPRKHVEKPTVTYVFRGVKLVTQNPHYVGHEEGAESDARAQLPVEHPDFSPTEACAPKLLFPEARRRDLSRRRARPAVPVPSSPTPIRRKTGSLSGDERRSVAGNLPVPDAPGPSHPEDEEDFDTMAAAMAARVARRIGKGVLAEGEVPRTRDPSRMRELPALPEKDRSDPIKRALGPARHAA